MRCLARLLLVLMVGCVSTVAVGDGIDEKAKKELDALSGMAVPDAAPPALTEPSTAPRPAPKPPETGVVAQREQKSGTTSVREALKLKPQNSVSSKQPPPSVSVPQAIETKSLEPNLVSETQVDGSRGKNEDADPFVGNAASYEKKIQTLREKQVLQKIRDTELQIAKSEAQAAIVPYTKQAEIAKLNQQSTASSFAMSPPRAAIAMRGKSDADEAKPLPQVVLGPRLTGVLTIDGKKYAVLKMGDVGVTAAVGDSVGDSKVSAIEDARIVLQGSRGTQTLTLDTTVSRIPEGKNPEPIVNTRSASSAALDQLQQALLEGPGATLQPARPGAPSPVLRAPGY